MAIRDEILRSPAWLQDHLEDENLRLFDVTTILRPDPEKGFAVESGRAGYDEAHIPGAGFLDLQGTFSVQDSPLRFTLPDADAFAAAAGAEGIGNGHHLVFYSTTNVMWATRLWWMFRAFGHDQVSVLDGGLAKWQSDGRSVSQEAASYPATSYTAKLAADRVADRSRVLAAIDSQASCVINSLGADQFRGESGNYGRPGHIKSSRNLPFYDLLDEDGCFLADDALHEKLAGTGALDAEEVITYCGGGIAATVDFFALSLLGMEDKVAVYDNSLSEWANDDSLPMEVG